MGLVGLKSGGYPAMDSSGTSTLADHPCGTIAFDSSGGEYIYARMAGTTVSFGSLVVLTANSSGSTAATASFNNLVAVLTSSATVNAGPIGIAQVASASSTTTFGWFQIYGNSMALTTAAGIGTGVPLWTSMDNLGWVVSSTAGARLTGINVNSSVGSSGLIPVFLQYPRVNNVG